MSLKFDTAIGPPWPKVRVDNLAAGDRVWIPSLGERIISGFSRQAWMDCPRIHFEGGGYAVARADVLWRRMP